MGEMMAAMEAGMIVGVILVCGVLGAIARHGLGGAWGDGGKTLAKVTYFPISVPALGIYLYDWTLPSAVIGVALVALAWADFLGHQEFGNLWRSLARYSAPVLLVAGMTGTWVVLTVVPVQFAATKWAKEKFPEGFDSHKYWEYIIGACLGLVYSAGPLLRGY